MFGDAPTSSILNPEPKIKLTSYSGDGIPCLGSIQLGLKRRSQKGEYRQEKFYVVDVTSPAVLGLPALERLSIVDINVDSLSTEEPVENALPPKIQTPITSVKQLKDAYPEQFDRIGKFEEPAKLYVKDDAVPFCNAPRKTSVNLKPKIKAELQNIPESNRAH